MTVRPSCNTTGAMTTTRNRRISSLVVTVGHSISNTTCVAHLSRHGERARTTMAVTRALIKAVAAGWATGSATCAETSTLHGVRTATGAKRLAPRSQEATTIRESIFIHVHIQSPSRCCWPAPPKPPPPAPPKPPPPKKPLSEFDSAMSGRLWPQRLHSDRRLKLRFYTTEPITSTTDTNRHEQTRLLEP